MNKIFNRLLEDPLRKQCFGKLGSVQSCHYVFMHYHFVKYSYFDSNLTEISSGGFNLSWKIHSIGSGDNTLLPEPMVTKFIDAFLHHHASLTWYLGNWFGNCCQLLICAIRLSWVFFIRPFEKRTYYAVVISVRPSVRVFRTCFQHALRYQFETWYLHSVGGTTCRVWVFLTQFAAKSRSNLFFPIMA